MPRQNGKGGGYKSMLGSIAGAVAPVLGSQFGGIAGGIAGGISKALTRKAAEPLPFRSTRGEDLPYVPRPARKTADIDPAGLGRHPGEELPAEEQNLLQRKGPISPQKAPTMTERNRVAPGGYDVPEARQVMPYARRRRLKGAGIDQ